MRGILNRVTLLEETSVPAALFGILLETVLVYFFCRKRPVSLKGGRRKDADSGSSSSELLATFDGFPARLRSGISSPEDCAVKLGIQ